MSVQFVRSFVRSERDDDDGWMLLVRFGGEFQVMCVVGIWDGIHSFLSICSIHSSLRFTHLLSKEGKGESTEGVSIFLTR